MKGRKGSLVCLPLVLAALFSGAADFDFVTTLLDRVASINGQVERNRQVVLSVRDAVTSGAHRNATQIGTLARVARNYGVNLPDKPRNADLNELLARVDAVPPSLLIAQAGLASDWGNHEAVTKGRNYFLIRCDIPGCGVVPESRPAGETWEWEKFVTVGDAVRRQVRRVNTLPEFAAFRARRAEMRAAEQPLRGADLASSLADGERIAELIREHGLSVHDG